MQIDDRSHQLNTVDQADGDVVLYLMARDQRVDDNHALLAAQEYAVNRRLPLCVMFFFLEQVLNRPRQHFEFMLDGLRDIEARLATRNIPLMLETGNPERILAKLNPSALFCDFSPLRGPQARNRRIADNARCPVYEVDTHNIVPAWITSDKEEFAARTIRPKIQRLLPHYLHEPPQLRKHPVPWDSPPTIDWTRIADSIDARDLPDYRIEITSGGRAAKRTLSSFISRRLERYPADRNNPVIDGLSGLSPYLHFGQISSLRVALEIGKWVENDGGDQRAADSFLEEIIIRKELSDNFCFYNRAYDSLDGIRDWARTTLEDHLDDVREHVYSLDEFEAAATADDAWNAAQLQMMRTGKMHGYMRMYWAKKLLEWSEHPARAVEHAVYLNDTYNLDGYDPNGYTGILWSIGGVHDRAWAERPVFGKVRYMNFNGLKRKFDVKTYINTFIKT